MVHVPYRDSGPALQDVLSGQVQMFIITPTSVTEQVQVGKLNGLAVAGKARHPGLPNVPTTNEAGLKGFELEAWVGISAPAGTSPDVVSKLGTAIKTALELPETRTRANGASVELRHLASTDLAALVTKDTELWARTIKTAGIKHGLRRVQGPARREIPWAAPRAASLPDYRQATYVWSEQCAPQPLHRAAWPTARRLLKTQRT